MAALGAGCSSAPKPRTAGREGLFDHWAKFDTGARGRSGRAIVSTQATQAAEDALESERARGEGAHVASSAGISDKHLAKLRDSVELDWPLKRTQVTSPFGVRHGIFHEGVDLKAPKGTPVFAAHAGKVVYAGRKIAGYGQMVILQHPSGVATVYAHHSHNLVRTGQMIKQGQQIAFSGASGRAKGPHLHFEVRSGVAAIDPLKLLPASGGVVTRKVAVVESDESPPALDPVTKKGSSHRRGKHSRPVRRQAALPMSRAAVAVRETVRSDTPPTAPLPPLKQTPRDVARTEQ